MQIGDLRFDLRMELLRTLHVVGQVFRRIDAIVGKGRPCPYEHETGQHEGETAANELHCFKPDRDTLLEFPQQRKKTITNSGVGHRTGCL